MATEVPGTRQEAHLVVADGVEFGAVATRDRLRRRQRQALEIHELAVAFDAEIEVRARGEARHAHQADTLALHDALAIVDEDARQVHVKRVVAVDMLNLDQVAVFALASRKNHAAVADRLHGRARGRAVIGPNARGIPSESDGNGDS